jgi:hypothetical protein
MTTNQAFDLCQNENFNSYDILPTFNPARCETSSNIRICDLNPNQNLAPYEQESFTYISNMNQEATVASIELSLTDPNRQLEQVQNKYFETASFGPQISQTPINSVQSFTSTDILEDLSKYLFQTNPMSIQMCHNKIQIITNQTNINQGNINFDGKLLEYNINLLNQNSGKNIIKILEFCPMGLN